MNRLRDRTFSSLQTEVRNNEATCCATSLRERVCEVGMFFTLIKRTIACDLHRNLLQSVSRLLTLSEIRFDEIDRSYKTNSHVDYRFAVHWVRLIRLRY